MVLSSAGSRSRTGATETHGAASLGDHQAKSGDVTYRSSQARRRGNAVDRYQRPQVNNGQRRSSLDYPPRRLHNEKVYRPLIAITLLLAFATPDAAAQETVPIPHLTPLAPGELQTMGEETKPALFRVHTVTTPDGLFQPIPLEAEGLAIWLTIGANEPILVTTYGYVSAAQTIEVLLEDEWAPAELVHGSPLFDLAMLQVEEPPDPATALSLVESWPMEANVYVPLATSDSTAPAEVVQGMLGGRRLPDMLSYYIRAQFWQRNGYPIVSRSGEVMAICSIFSPDGDGVLAIPFEQVAAWQSEWDNLDPNDPYNHRPEVRVERVNLTVEGAGGTAEQPESQDEERALPEGAIRGRFENTGAPP